VTSPSIFSPGLGEQVLKTLGRYARLPQQGVIAGQAVASAIDEVLGKGRPVYNDIDIFIDDQRWEQRWPEDLKHRRRHEYDEKGRLVRGPDHGLLADHVVYVADAQAESDGYDRHLSVGHRALYSIEHTRTEGLLNYVCVNWAHGGSRYALEDKPPEERAPLEMDWLTRVFDLNCTQAAVDLGTGQLHISPLFEQYYRTRQLQVVTGFTPAHSLLRYLKKRAELGAYGDDATHLALARMLVQREQGDAALAQVRRRAFRDGRIGITTEEVASQRERMDIRGYSVSWQRAGQGENSAPLSFGRKYFDLYLKHQKLLNQHFMLTRHNRRDIWLLTSKTSDNSLDGSHVHVSPTMVALRFAENRLAPSKQALARQQGLAELVEAMKNERHAGYALEKAAANFGPAYTEGMEDPNLRKRWLEVCPKHTECFWPIVALPFRDQVTLMRRMRTEFKKIGIRDPWGTLVQTSSCWARELLTDETQWQSFLEEHRGTLEPLCKPLPLPVELSGVVVRELITSRDLVVEGAKQRHCVGGYSSSVREGYCRIVSFALGESSQERSTAEWNIRAVLGERDAQGNCPVTAVRFECNQHQGAGNTAPPAPLEEAEVKAREQMNQWAQNHLAEAVALLELGSRGGVQSYDDDDIF
jgi:hypothetical protein